MGKSGKNDALFSKKKRELGHDTCVLDAKTVVLDDNASELLEIHKYCIEDLKCDTHSFQFLKGSPIQHSDIMFPENKIFEKSSAYIYKNWRAITEELEKVRNYNIENKKTGYLHPAVASIIDDSSPINIDILNNQSHDKKLYKPCAAPWGSVHINVDGTLFPCLAIDMGNVKNRLEKYLWR